MDPQEQRFPVRTMVPAALLLLTILVAYVCFTLATLPSPGFPILSINKSIFETISTTLTQDWKRLLLPMTYEKGRIYWQPATIFFTYAAERYWGPLPSYLFFSSLFITVSFVSSLIVTRSLLFAAVVGYMFAFGTQLNYVYTYGSLIPLFLVEIYCALNLTIVALLASGRIGEISGRVTFVLTLGLLAVASEWWLNYAVALVAGAGFGLLWARHHADRNVFVVCRFFLLATVLIAACYLAIRLHFPGQFTTRGEEEELMFSYSSPALVVDDFVTNFFTFLYLSLDNYFPSFVSASNSLVYIGPPTIIAEQNGYHQQFQNLVLMSHVFMWRFYAGIAASFFFAGLLWACCAAWRSRTMRPAIIVALMLMVATGFSTHLFIKMRPYNSVPGLSYKVTISVAALTVLIAYLLTIAAERMKSVVAYRSLVASVLACVFLAALTRPGMQAKLLEQVGLVGLRDPAGQIVHLIGH